ncbi:DUF6273 domain-containing protein [Butyrivibrio sp. AE3009]|uniref:DUF6273 domain-containing protein n=1 Tax=Butyrivibrio sp. AE3009 TaxID=1280666 RepID=UPI001FA7E704|nr:DUF6273 domain-containing protein [Butyrivibrio sp. AE3009]
MFNKCLKYKGGLKWRESTLRSFLNATLYRNLDESSQYIVNSCKENMSLDDRQLGSTEFAPLNNDKFFALDHAEIRNPKYGYRKKGEITYDNATLKKYGNKYVPYWLRSTIDEKNMLTHADCAEVNYDAATYRYWPTLRSYRKDTEQGISPACNIDISKILFTSKANGYFRFTFLAEYRNIEVPSGKRISVRGSVITVPFHISGRSLDD